TARFDAIGDLAWRLTAKEYAYARLTRRIEGCKGLPAPPTVVREVRVLRAFFAHLTEYHPGLRLAEIGDDAVFDGFLATCRGSARWQAQERARHAWALTLLHRVGEQLTHDRLTHLPWRGRPAQQIAGRRAEAENRTPRIPSQVMGPYLRGALFYVQTAATDILAAADELARLEQETAYRFIPETLSRLDRFVEQRRREGRGMPATPDWCLPAAALGAHELGINVHLLATLLRTNRVSLSPGEVRRRIEAAVAEIGVEPGGMDTPVSADPATGEPWRARFHPKAVTNERRFLMTACYVIIAYLSGMRDSEVQSLTRGCYFREPTADGLLSRHKIRGTVFKGRGPTGEPDTWVVIEPVAEAVDVLERLVDDELLFSRVSHRQRWALLGGDINPRLNELRDHLNRTRPHDAVPEVDGHPWRFTTRQFRRSVAWHIAHQPFGVVAGKIQYKHARVAMFEGYAGTSASGFPAEIEAERELDRLESFLDRYEDFKAGVQTPARLAEKFTHIRDELGDFPGQIVDTSRLRAMMANAARTYHPGVLNDCYFDPAAALCTRHHRHTNAGDAPPAAKPVLNHCQPALCPNSCVTAKHAPAINRVIADARELLSIQRLSPHQRAALREQITTAQGMLAPLEAPPG
uniref:hypothetical protein n=1 Tax=Frankia tisae TaxID=2950104 RepID=UPI0021C19F5B